MSDNSPTLHEPPSGSPIKPKGILKNRSGSTTSTHDVLVSPPPSGKLRPGPERELSEREIVLQNTLRNAGPRRRSSSALRGVPHSRRQSAGSGVVSGPPSEHGDLDDTRLRWDEANLYLAEQDRGTHMKITEPKTPYAQQYDPSDDESEVAELDAQNLVVDEVDALKLKKARKARTEDIPGLDIGEPEIDTEILDAPTPESEKRVIVERRLDGEEDEGHHGEDPADLPEEEKQKHKKFEEMRKKHYEMKNVKNLLAHHEFDDDDDSEEKEVPLAPPLPPQQVAGEDVEMNGQ